MAAKVKRISRDIAQVIQLVDLYKQCELVAIDVDSDGVESHPDDSLLLGYLEAAVDSCEAFTGLTLAPTIFEMALDQFPCPRGRWSVSREGWRDAIAVELPRAPFVALLEAVTGNDSDGTIDPAAYTVDDFSMPARVVPVSAWPAVTTATNRIRFRWLAGYGDSSDGAEPLPDAIRQALLMLVAHWYQNREPVVVGMTVAELPFAIELLLRPKRILLGMA